MAKYSAVALPIPAEAPVLQNNRFFSGQPEFRVPQRVKRQTRRGDVHKDQLASEAWVDGEVLLRHVAPRMTGGRREADCFEHNATQPPHNGAVARLSALLLELSATEFSLTQRQEEVRTYIGAWIAKGGQSEGVVF